MEDTVLRMIPPSKCHSCGCSKFHKDEKRSYDYHDFMGNRRIVINIQRRRYRCSNCGTKQWDQVCGASTYSKKTYRLILWEGKTNRPRR